jgi:hypothetical protein
MGQINIYDTAIYNITGIKEQMNLITKFLINYRDVRIPSDKMNIILKTKVLTNTPVNLIFSNMILSRKEEIFASLNVPSGIMTPEIITMPHVLIDVLQLKEVSPGMYNTVNSLPEYKDKLILNISHLLKKHNELVVSDMNELQSLFVRAALVRSYYNTDNWLMPALIKYLSESYSMTISANIAGLYSLTYQEQLVVATALTAYFHKMCYNSKDTEFPVSINDCAYLGNRIDIIKRLEHFKEVLGGHTKMDLGRLCDLIVQTGPDRMNTFNLKALYTRCRRLGSDELSSQLAIEYPPYWAHQVILVLSGVKTGLFFAMKKQGKLIPNGAEFIQGLNRANSFIPQL